jgi:hypothetical protein
VIEEPKREAVLKRLEHVVNSLSLENESNTPDWILARYLVGCLDVFDACVRERERWYGRADSPATPPISEEKKT